jgi:hypothetical protein
MIRSTNLTAVRTAVNPQPLPQKSLVAKIGRLGDSVSLNPQPLPPKSLAAKIGRLGDSVSLNPQPLPPKSLAAKIGRLGDSVSLNPQPLPPKAVFANVKASVSAVNTKRLAAGQSDRFLTANVRSSPATPVATLLSSQWSADGFLQLKASPVFKSSILAAIKAQHTVDQLTKAETLMESAYRRMSNPNRNYVDALRAREEMGQALQIRKSVMPDLSELQQKALSAVSDKEQQGIEDAAWATFDLNFSVSAQKGAEELEAARKEFQVGVQENQSLINWILS